MEALLNMPHQNVSARFNEMRNGGLILRTDDTRTTRRGRHADVYVVAPGITEENVSALRPERHRVGTNWMRLVEQLAATDPVVVFSLKEPSKFVRGNGDRTSICALCGSQSAEKVQHKGTCPWLLARQALGMTT